MRTIFILKGLPGSGKSHFAAELIRKEPGRFVRINRDDLRSMAVGPGNNPHARDNDREELVRTFKNDLTRQAIREGYDVILDDTHLVPATVKKLHVLAASVGDVKVIEKAFDVSVDECIRRDDLRTGFARVGEKIIRDMARGAGLDKKRVITDREIYYPPRWSPGGPGADPYKVQQDDSLPKAVICDLDGTLSLMNGRSPYDTSTCDKDLPNVPVIECVKAMHVQGYAILFTSGREEKAREPTARFIEQWVRVPPTKGLGALIPGSLSVNDGLVGISYSLFMRATADMRKDSIVKRELFDAHIAGKYNVVFCLDDRNQVVDFWREIGLTAFQVAPGNF